MKRILYDMASPESFSGFPIHFSTRGGGERFPPWERGNSRGGGDTAILRPDSRIDRVSQYWVGGWGGTPD